MSPLDKQFPSGPWKVIIQHRDAYIANNKNTQKGKNNSQVSQSQKAELLLRFRLITLTTLPFPSF